MKLVLALSTCLLGMTLSSCTKKMGSQAVGALYSCSVKKGETRQTCTEFKNLSPNEVAYFKQKCDSESSMDAAAWQDVGCATDARQGGCELKFADATSNISTSFIAWGYTATSLAAIQAPNACEKNGGRIVQP
ncbi:hypothetical protein EBU99_07660 [bacterium]|nr:hypothetical protein [bacterium]